MKCLIVLSVGLVCSMAAQISPLANQYVYLPQRSSQDALLSYVAVNNPVLVRQEPIYVQEQVPQLEIVSHRGSFAHYVNPRNYQTFQASLQSSAIPSSNVLALTRGGNPYGNQPLVAVQRTESRIDFPGRIQSSLQGQVGQKGGPQGGIQELQQGSPIGPQVRLSGLTGPSSPRFNLNAAQRGPISNLQREGGSARGLNYTKSDQLPRRS